jgi:heme/copper-type cytochrome/quinol oxidase subunit 2
MKKLWLLLALAVPLQSIHAQVEQQAAERLKRELHTGFTLIVLAIAVALVLCVLYAISRRYRK